MSIQATVDDVLQLLRQIQDQYTSERIANIALTRQIRALQAEHADCKKPETP